MKFKWLLIVLVLVLGSGCEKQDPPPPSSKTFIGYNASGELVTLTCTFNSAGSYTCPVVQP
jgi:hypothetical protein